jgi:hypothetical protein
MFSDGHGSTMLGRAARYIRQLTDSVPPVASGRARPAERVRPVAASTSG